jgi:hypothetical protein
MFTPLYSAAMSVAKARNEASGACNLYVGMAGLKVTHCHFKLQLSTTVATKDLQEEVEPPSQ